MPSRNILLIEDDQTISLTVQYALTREGYGVTCAADGGEGLRDALTQRPDLVLLDIMLPTMGGFEIAKKIREHDEEVPIIMLTALDRDEDKVRGLDAGADDYVTKPFSTDELLARIRANMRRAHASSLPSGGVLAFGDMEIDITAGRVRVGGVTVELRSKEFSLLVALASRPGALCRREWLSQEVWGEEFLPTSRTIDVHIRRIRSAIETISDYTYIHTVHGMGYRFEPVRNDA